MENYPIEQCYGCIHRQVCKHIPVIEKAMKLKDKLPLYIEEDCEDYAPEQSTTTVKESASNLTQEILKAIKGGAPVDTGAGDGIHRHVTMINSDETETLTEVMNCVMDAMEKGMHVTTAYINQQMMDEIMAECQVDGKNGPIHKVIVNGVHEVNLKIDNTIPYMGIMIE